MDKKTYYFSVDGVIEEDEPVAFETTWNISEYPLYALEDAAQFYYDNCEGYDDNWPLVFKLHEYEHSEPTVKASVNMEYSPTFMARVLNDEEE